MSLQLIDDRLSRFLIHLEFLDDKEQQDAFAGEILETGGHLAFPTGDGAHLFEYCLHGVVGAGRSEEEARRAWKRAAANMLSEPFEANGFVTVHPPFPRPRNHAEEIANARAEAGAA